MKHFLLLLLMVGFVACNQEKPKETPVSIDTLLEQDKYEEAFAAISEMEDGPETRLLKEKAHLNYGLFLEYRDSDVTNMRDKMNGALAQYVEVLKINKDNEKAISEIEQILGIYSTFPDRSPDEAIVEELKALGFSL